MDFYTIRVKEEKDGSHTVFADWIVHEASDLLVNRGAFQAVWNEHTGLWSTNEYDVARLVDEDLKAFTEEYTTRFAGVVNVRYLRHSGSKAWNGFQRYVKDLPENRRDLDAKLIFANTEVKKEDYATRRLPYPLEEGTCDAWDEIVGTLYSDEEREKIEWAIGSIVEGDSHKIQKFLVFYGKPGSGKSTVLDIIKEMFDGYTAIFNAKDLTSSSNQFATAPFALNPLVGLQHDGDLSRIEDNTILNMITAHEDIIVNQKFAKPYEIRAKAMLFMGTNEPVKIKNAKAGIIRRLIDVVPSGDLIEVSRYHILISQARFELGAIAEKCRRRYVKLGKDYYISYSPVKMQFQTDVFYNFVEAHHDMFQVQDGVSLRQAWTLYKEYCSYAGVDRTLPMYKFRAELENYFAEVIDRYETDSGEKVRNYYKGYKDIMHKLPDVSLEAYQIELEEATSSAFDVVYRDQPAQYTRPSGDPAKKWAQVTTTLKDVDPTKLHFVQVPTQHIVIDFDLVDEDGEKDLAKNLEEAAKWPPTYTELSRSGKGVHLHYIYVGNVEELANVYDVGVEVKTLLGNQALRRMLTKCNNLAISIISSGLPKKEVKRVIDHKNLASEKGLRELIGRNLRKEIHPGTKPSIDFIHKILEDAYSDGLSYDVRDLRPKILAFAAKSSNQRELSIKIVQSMRFVGQENMPPPENMDEAPIVFFDVEVFPNLFVCCYKIDGEPEVVRMVNPTPHDMEPLLSQKLVGFNNRRYDNHIVYARYLGHDLEGLYRLSSRLIAGNQSAYFGEAFQLSYTDIYDFSSKKQGLKKFEIELGISHMELDLPWDEPVPDDMVDKVVEYCVNDVNGTQETFYARQQDFKARLMLAELSTLTPNHTTAQHTARILFGGDREPQSKFNYPDLSLEFEGYHFDGKESTYRGETVGEGGYVYAEPGIYENVALLDVASMHPTSIEQLNLFGPYTANFSGIKEARMAIKRKDFEEARSLLGGRLSKFLVDAENDPAASEGLSYALKIAINTVYGLTSASFDNPFRDLRNKDNVVAKRGALFMVDLKHAVQQRGFVVAHIKTDSIKIPNATQEIIDFVSEFGAQYGYDFEHEATYDKFCLVNDAVYIARKADVWTAVGKQFAEPYVYKSLFSKEPIEFDDLCQIRSVNKGAIYYDPSGTGEMGNMLHVGRVGVFVPVKHGGGDLWRVDGDRKFTVTGTKGYKWVTKEVAHDRNALDDLFVDMDFFEKQVDEARKAIDAFGSYLEFVL